MIDWYAELLHKENQAIMSKRKSSYEIKPRQAESDFNDRVAIGLIVLVVSLCGLPWLSRIGISNGTAAIHHPIFQ